MRDLAEALGYRLRGNRSNACPACGPRRRSAVQVGDGGWKCHACEEGGGPFNFIAWHDHGKAWSDLGGAQRDAVRALAAELGAATPARPRLPSSWGSLPVPHHWGRLGDPGPTPEALEWMRGRWGSEVVAAIVADVGEPLAVNAAALPALRPMDDGYRLAMPLRAWGGPRHGAVVSAAHRWCDDGDAPQGKERFVARSRTKLPAGAVLAFGDPGRITRYTNTIILAEGGGDWLAACGVVRLEGRSGAAEVVGLPGAGRARVVGEALAEHLRGILDGTMKAQKHGRACRVDGQPVAGTWRVVLATDADQAGDRAALDIRGALGGLPVEVVRPRWARGVDLSDRLAELGPAGLWRELANAPEWCAPAAPVAAIYGADAMPLEDARRDGIANALDDALDDAAYGRMLALAMPVGVGKTQAALQAVAERSEQCERFAIVVANWAFAAEVVDKLAGLAPDLEVALWQGVSAACHDGEDDAGPVLARSAWEDAGRPAHWRATVCPRCPLRKGCAAHARDEAPVVVMAHAMMAHLPPGAIADRTIIIDEQPAYIGARRWTVRELHRVRDGALNLFGGAAGRAAERRQQAAWAAWAPVHAALGDLAGDRGPHGIRRDGTEDDAITALRCALAAARVDPVALVEALDAGGRDTKPWNIPLPNVDAMLRAGRAPARAVLPRDSHRLFQVLGRDVRRALGLPPADEDDGGGMLTIYLPPDGAPAYERRDVQHLPAGGGVILDATAPAVSHVYATLGVDVRTLAVEADPESETLRVFRRTRGLARSGLLGRGIGPAVVNRVLGDLRFAMGEVRNRAPKRWRSRVGLLTYKPIVDALNKDDATGAWAELQRETLRMGIDELGYFGKDEEGTNRFEDCDCLIVLGDPRPNLGERLSDLAAIGIRGDDAKAALNRELGKTLAQAVGRPRADTRKGFHAVVVIGAAMPATWDRRSVVEVAKRPADAQRAAVTTAALRLAAMTGCAVTSWLEAVVGLAARRAANADIGHKAGSSAISVGPSSELPESLRNRPEVTALIDAAEQALRESLPANSTMPSARTIRRGVSDATAALRAEGWRVDTKPLPGRASWRSVSRPDLSLEDSRAMVGWFVTWKGDPAPLHAAARVAWAWWLADAETVDALPQEGEDTPASDPEALASSRAVESWGYDRGPPS